MALFIQFLLPRSRLCLGEERGVGWQLASSFEPYVWASSQQENSTSIHWLWSLCCLGG